jgi:hypothetical protein
VTKSRQSEAKKKLYFWSLLPAENEAEKEENGREPKRDESRNKAAIFAGIGSFGHLAGDCNMRLDKARASGDGSAPSSILATSKVLRRRSSSEIWVSVLSPLSSGLLAARKCRPGRLAIWGK